MNNDSKGVWRNGVLKAPFPWFGGKSRVSQLVWSRFGDLDNFVEPFFGSGAVLLGRPRITGVETANDLDCYVANFWRSLQADAVKLAQYADWPVNEADLLARHKRLKDAEKFRDRIKTDPDYYDVKLAGWWVWGLSAWLGSGWCEIGKEQKIKLPAVGSARGVMKKSMSGQKLPRLSGDQDIRRIDKTGSQKLPTMGKRGNQGIRRIEKNGSNYLPQLSTNQDIRRIGRLDAIIAEFTKLQDRLREVRFACGDWTRVLSDSVTLFNGTTGVFLDPPYANEEHTVRYAANSDVSGDVCKWAIENGTRRGMRIALCGYEGEHKMPDSWECIPWKAVGGFGNQGKSGKTKGKENARRERIWFSPYCLKRSLF